VIEISPHIENLHIDGADQGRLPEDAGKKGVDALENSGVRAPGVFAAILAGLSSKTAPDGREGNPENVRAVPPDEGSEAGEYGGAEDLVRGLVREKNAGGKTGLQKAGEKAAVLDAAGNAAVPPSKTPDAGEYGEMERPAERIFPGRLLDRKPRAVQAEGDDGKGFPDASGGEAFLSAETEAEEKRTGLSGTVVPEIPAPALAGAVFHGESPVPRAGDRSPETAGETPPDFPAASFPAGDGTAAEKIAEKAAGPARENRGEAAGTRGKKREKSAMVVEDLRTAGNAGGETAFSPDKEPSGVPRTAAFSREAEMTVELRGHKVPAGERGSLPDGNSGTFEHFLARELQQGLSDGIVREARLVLRDGGEGTIRLSLKPESLGNVKIRLEMTENKIMGHVVVESEEVLRAFERETHSLERAFLDSGFDGAELDFSLAQGGEGGEGRREDLFFREWRRGVPLPEDPFRYEAAGLEDSEFFADGVFRLNGRTQVNMLI
jgi:hypothetical protein